MSPPAPANCPEAQAPVAPARRIRRLCAAALLLALPALPATAFAQAERYELDPVHTRVMFEISHAGYSQAIGTVSGSTGVLVFDPADWSSARVEVSVPLQRLELGDAKWNRAALGRNLLDGDGHPLATFVSTRVEAVDDTHARVFGTLTLRGVAQEVALDVAFNQLERYPLPPFPRTAGFSATTTISRKAFGIDAWPGVIGDSVALRIEAEAQRARGGSPVDAGDAAPEPDDTPAPPVPTEDDAPAPPIPTEDDAPAPPVPTEDGAPAPTIPIEEDAPAPTIPIEDDAPAPTVPTEDDAPVPAVPTEDDAPEDTPPEDPSTPPTPEPTP